MKQFFSKIRKNFQNLHLNLFDYAVILSLVAIFAIFMSLRYSKKTEWISIKVRISNDEWWWEAQPPDFWYVNNLQPHQESYSSFGEKIAEITSIENFDIGGTKRRASVDLKLKVSFDKKRGVYIYNFQPLQIGKPLDLTFGKNNVRGIVTYIDNETVKYSMRKIDVKVFSARPWVTESYKKGMQMLDSNGKVLAEVEDVSWKNTENYDFYDSLGRRFVVKGNDPTFQDVSITLNVLVYKADGVEYFLDGAAVKIGENIWFHFPQAIIRNAEITKIYN
jgi:hypothetical protein